MQNFAFNDDLLCADSMPIFREINQRSTENRFTTFKLNDIYQNLHGNAATYQHTAEGDAITLLMCAIAKNNEFIQIADSMAVKFNDNTT